MFQISNDYLFQNLNIDLVIFTSPDALYTSIYKQIKIIKKQIKNTFQENCDPQELIFQIINDKRNLFFLNRNFFRVFLIDSIQKFEKLDSRYKKFSNFVESEILETLKMKMWDPDLKPNLWELQIKSKNNYVSGYFNREYYFKLPFHLDVFGILNNFGFQQCKIIKFIFFTICILFYNPLLNLNQF